MNYLGSESHGQIEQPGTQILNVEGPETLSLSEGPGTYSFHAPAISEFQHSSQMWI